MRTKRSKAMKIEDAGRAWADSPDGQTAYRKARAEAQEKANRLRMDVGIELNPIFKSFHVFLLPSAQHRCGHELRCEAVLPMGVDTLPGHGHGPTQEEVGKVLTPRYC
jgi:hypothetical protein